MSGPQRYPLDWPSTEPRTPSHLRTRSRFDVSQARAARELLHELERMGADDVVLSTNIELRLDGLPYSNRRPPVDPGVACFWEVDGDQFAMACDTYRDVRSNIRAIGKTVEALRSIERHGSRALRDRAFRGFAQLPASITTPAPRSWREVLEIPHGVIVPSGKVEARYRDLAKKRHPDAGGTVEAMAELNRARREALEDVGR